MSIYGPSKPVTCKSVPFRLPGVLCEGLQSQPHDCLHTSHMRLLVCSVFRVLLSPPETLTFTHDFLSEVLWITNMDIDCSSMKDKEETMPKKSRRQLAHH